MHWHLKLLPESDTHVTSHILLAKASHMAIFNFKGAEKSILHAQKKKRDKNFCWSVNDYHN